MTIKNVYSIFDEDGRIMQSHKVFDDENGAYGRVLAEREMTFISHAGPSHADLDRDYVFKGELSERPIMPASLDRTTIGIGDSNGATIRNVPRGATLTIYAGGIQFFTGQVNGTQVDLSAPVPGLYVVMLSKWPYRDWRAEVIAQ